MFKWKKIEFRNWYRIEFDLKTMWIEYSRGREKIKMFLVKSRKTILILSKSLMCTYFILVLFLPKYINTFVTCVLWIKGENAQGVHFMNKKENCIHWVRFMNKSIKKTMLGQVHDTDLSRTLQIKQFCQIKLSFKFLDKKFH